MVLDEAFLAAHAGLAVAEVLVHGEAVRLEASQLLVIVVFFSPVLQELVLDLAEAVLVLIIPLVCVFSFHLGSNEASIFK